MYCKISVNLHTQNGKPKCDEHTANDLRRSGSISGIGTNVTTVVNDGKASGCPIFS
ncbi:MAG: hypothetical protein LBJ00_04635 [Planctomycetaceae bacterium]|nr:hypothetical protein [Planctomycetaceae bacterium]